MHRADKITTYSKKAANIIVAFFVKSNLILLDHKNFENTIIATIYYKSQLDFTYKKTILHYSK